MTADGYEEKQILSFAAALEKSSEHPLARAIVRKAEQKSVRIETVEKFTALSGLGAKALMDGQRVLIGNRFLMTDEGIAIDDWNLSTERLTGEGKTVVYLALGKSVVGLIALADTPKASAARTVQRLQSRGMKVAMITGDNDGTARAIARQLGIEKVMANVLPGKKAEEIKNLQDAGEIVAMVGDGINDAPALAVADVGIAIGRERTWRLKPRHHVDPR